VPGREPELIFTNWHHGITGINPATGKVSWENDVFGKPDKERAIGSPIIAGELVIGGQSTASDHLPETHDESCPCRLAL